MIPKEGFVMLKLLNIDEFSFRIVIDMQKYFPVVKKEKDFIYVEHFPTNMSIPIRSIYSEYCVTRNYNHTLNTYVNIANKILNQYKFQVNYKNIFPILKHRNFGHTEQHLQFYRKPLFADIDLLYVTDEGDIFRFILESDDFDKEKLEKSAMENLNKMTNILGKLDDSLDIYALRYTTDYGATMILNDSILKQIHKAVGQDYLFCIPSSTSLIVAKNHKPYINIIKSLILADNDPNKISNAIYRCNHGVYSIADPNLPSTSPNLTVIK